MSNNIVFRDLGTINYKDAWDYQDKLHSEIVTKKVNNAPEYEQFPEYILFVEHPHVYTLGKSGDEQNLLISALQLQAKDAEFFKTNRGGDITYHGPGQIVGYPIIDLDKHKIGVKKYVYILEESIIQTIKMFGLAGSRLEGATGVWLDAEIPGQARKICAIGVRVSRGVTMHGFAFNVNTNLAYFDYINPCGFTDKGVTSLSKELGQEISMEEVKPLLLSKLIALLK